MTDRELAHIFDAAYWADVQARRAYFRVQRKASAGRRWPAYTDPNDWSTLERRFGRLPRLNACEWDAYARLKDFRSREARKITLRYRIEPDFKDRWNWYLERSRRDRAIQWVHDSTRERV